MSPSPSRPLRAVALVIAAAVVLPSAGIAAADLEPVASVEGITEYRLGNGLRVLLFPDASKATVTVNVTYLVGSRHEGRGEKGMAHLLEHMLFKGTATYRNIWGALEEHGASFNGTTWVDRTNYYETLPAGDGNLRFALRMEADRMVNSRLDAEDLASEMTVVRNEFEMGENDPVGVLMERLISTAYLWHNYGFSTIGNRSDIERVPIENLRRFYERYYQPDNAMLVVAGRFDPAPTLGWIEESFGAIPRPQRTLDATWTEEPPQDGSRFVTLNRGGSSQAAGAVYHVCAGSHPDFPALQVLADVLTTRPSGRLYETLVPTDLATSVRGMVFPTREPGVLLLLASTRVEQDVRAAHDAIVATAEGVAEAGITGPEIERAKSGMLKAIRMSLADSGRIGVELSEWAAMGDWRMLFVNRDRLAAVTLDDVVRVARTYLVESNRTSGIFVPTDDAVRATVPATPDVEALVAGYESTETIASGEAFAATPRNIERRTRRSELSNGMRVALLDKQTRGDAVVASFAFHFGTEATLREGPAAVGMIPALLMRGTRRLDFQQLRDEIDRIQSQVSVSGGQPGTIVASIVSDRAHLAAAIELLGEIMKEPAFPPDQLEIIRKELLAGLETQRSDPQARLFTELRRALHPYPEDSVYYVPALEEQIERVAAVTLEQVEGRYRALLGASHAEVAVVGDFEPTQIEAALERTFGAWASPAPYARPAKRPGPTEPLETTLVTPDRPMAAVAMGTGLRLSEEDPDYPLLDFANYVLGASAQSRLMNRLRHEGGLSYGAGSMIQADPHDDVAGFGAFAICAPQNAGKAQAEMQDVVEAWIRDGLTEQELEAGRGSYLMEFERVLTDDRAVAAMLRMDLELDRSFEFHADQVRRAITASRESIAAAIRDHLSSASMVRMKAGDLDE